LTRQAATASATKEFSGSASQATGSFRPKDSRPRDQARLLNVVRRLRENETILVLMRETFRMFQRMGISVSPNHYYWPVPDFSELEKRTWPAPQIPVGFDLELGKQLEFLERVVPRYAEEWASESAAIGSVGYTFSNGFFEVVDAEIAYCLVRHLKPKRIIEVGGGYSSRVMAAALKMNDQVDGVVGDLVTIDPYPDRFPQKALSDRVHLITEPIQSVDLEIFLTLRDGDFLFLDSSHVVGIGSDVVKEYLEILPRLDAGVVVHAHDIFIPSDYPREAVLKNLAFWSEQYLLQALLMFNPNFEVLWGSSAMQTYESETLERTFPRWKYSYRNMPRNKRQFLPTVDGDRVWPSSFWIRKTA